MEFSFIYQLAFCHLCKRKQVVFKCFKSGKITSCNKKFCATCLHKYYQEDIVSVMQRMKDWNCPFRQSACCCSRCHQNQNNYRGLNDERPLLVINKNGVTTKQFTSPKLKHSQEEDSSYYLEVNEGTEDSLLNFRDNLAFMKDQNLEELISESSLDEIQLEKVQANQLKEQYPHRFSEMGKDSVVFKDPNLELWFTQAQYKTAYLNRLKAEEEQEQIDQENQENLMSDVERYLTFVQEQQENQVEAQINLNQKNFNNDGKELFQMGIKNSEASSSYFNKSSFVIRLDMSSSQMQSEIKPQIDTQVKVEQTTMKQLFTKKKASNQIQKQNFKPIQEQRANELSKKVIPKSKKKRAPIKKKTLRHDVLSQTFTKKPVQQSQQVVDNSDILDMANLNENNQINAQSALIRIQMIGQPQNFANESLIQVDHDYNIIINKRDLDF
eukprot:403348150